MAFDGAAWEEAMVRLRPLLRHLAGRGLNPRFWRRTDPSDLVQITVAEAHRNRADFHGTTERELVAWLRMILGHRILDEVRKLQCQKNNMEREVELNDSVRMVNTWTSPLSALVRHEEALRVAAALEKLPDDQRRAIELVHFHKLKPSEAARLMARTKGSVTGLVRRAQETLRELLPYSR